MAVEVGVSYGQFELVLVGPSKWSISVFSFRRYSGSEEYYVTVTDARLYKIPPRSPSTNLRVRPAQPSP